MISESILSLGLEPLIKGMGTVLGKSGIEFAGKQTAKFINRKGNLTQEALNFFRPIAKEYIKNYTERHGILKVLGMQKPVNLDDVYVTVQLLNPETLKKFESLEELEYSFRQERRFQPQKIEKQPGIDIANNEKYLMVLGGPGMGKSTFLRKVGLEALKGKIEKGYKHTVIPVFIELKQFRSGEIDLEKAIAKEFENCGLPRYQECTSHFLSKGKLLLLFDGLDEVPTELMGDLVTKLKNFVDRYSQNRFISSCRIAAYRSNFTRFTDVAIADFDNQQIENFVTNWFGKESDMTNECQKKLNNDDYASVKELTQNPLLLTLVCLVYQRSGQFPNKRVTLYDKALRILLEEWNAAKEIPNQYLGYKNLDTRAKEAILSEIAYENFWQNRLFFERRNLIKQIEKLLKEEILPDDSSVNGADVIRDIEVQHGLLVERAEGIYSFSHLTFQEFFTAKNISYDYEDIKQLIKSHLCDPRWREVFLLIGGLVNKADKFLLAIEQQIQTYVTSPKLRALLAWVEQIVDDSQSDIKLVGKRAIVLAYAHAYTYAHAYADALAHADTLADAYAHAYYAKANAYALTDALAYAKAYAKAYALTYATDLAKNVKKLSIYKNINFNELFDKLDNLKNQIPDRNELPEIHLNFANEITKTMLEAFQLTKDMIDFSEEEAKALKNYLYTNKLMLDCKNAAVRVSQITWNEIEDRMLKPTQKNN